MYPYMVFSDVTLVSAELDAVMGTLKPETNKNNSLGSQGYPGYYHGDTSATINP